MKKGAEILRKLLCLLLCCLLPFSALAEGLDWMDSEEDYPDYLYVPGRGCMRYYAQNDPQWKQMRFRYPHQQNSPTFSGTGCVPTALANCIANLLIEDKLAVLGEYSKGSGFYICPCSMNQMECNRKHERYQLQTELDFDRFLCLAIGSYMSGNNPAQQYACGTMFLLDDLMKIYGLRYQKVDNLHQAAEMVRADQAMAVCLVGGEDCPFTQSGHALVFCHADDQEYYFLDSYYRLNYEWDRQQIVRIVEPGVVAVSKDKISRLGASSIYVIWPQE